jgi:hypothetical protein
MAPRPSPDLSSLSIDTNMLKNDSGATGISAYGAVFAFEVSTDVRRDRFFPVVAAGIISTLPSSPTLIDATPSEKKDPRPIAGTQTSTVTYFTADQTTATQSDVTICLHHPSSMTHPSAERHLACQMTVSSATKLNRTDPILRVFCYAPSGALHANTNSPSDVTCSYYARENDTYSAHSNKVQ